MQPLVVAIQALSIWAFAGASNTQLAALLLWVTCAIISGELTWCGFR